MKIQKSSHAQNYVKKPNTKNFGVFILSCFSPIVKALGCFSDDFFLKIFPGAKPGYAFLCIIAKIALSAAMLIPVCTCTRELRGEALQFRNIP
jgi:hypothetical protein